ncbi:50S ribosomal protein L10 [Infirmifilum lucidum]|uniref:Large ribosomal subunit protein uL10 n=1 Tax=Infirmifilum lucidum TaxID=2776706 RepID=A0A7L9FF96_9CREN|nr:50S ribosomal protein L10 [Infirmifilum lucidum]QOJ78399.1 50S ribosomal protein L10 [Infirmifilum lucidum]
MSQTVVLQTSKMSPARARKARLVEELKEYLRNYRYFMLAGTTGLPSSVIKGSRRLLYQKGSALKVIKNTLFLIALKEVGKYSDQFKDALKGQNAVIFTNENPFEVILFLDKQKILREARPGDVATREILIPAGNTGITPGPAISLFNKLNIPIRVQEGSIWVTKDTVVAKPGDVVTPELADLLNKLGMKPIESKLNIKLIVIDGRVVKPEDVELDPNLAIEKLRVAYSQAFNLAFNAALPVPQIVSMLVAKAYLQAMAVAVEAGIPDKSTLPYTLARAHSAALAIYNLVKSKNPSF